VLAGQARGRSLRRRICASREWLSPGEGAHPSQTARRVSRVIVRRGEMCTLGAPVSMGERRQTEPVEQRPPAREVTTRRRAARYWPLPATSCQLPATSKRRRAGKRTADSKEPQPAPISSLTCWPSLGS
jgi:hypothetical protein